MENHESTTYSFVFKEVMETKNILLLACLIYLQVVHSQYYGYPTSSLYSPYTYSSYFQSPSYTATPSYQATLPSPSVRPAKKGRSVRNPPAGPKCSPPSATAYYLPSAAEKPKLISKETSLLPPKYTCPLCNGFADLVPNSKILPPPPVGSPVLPGIIDSVPILDFAEDLKLIKDVSAALTPLSSKTPLFPDMYEKQKLNKNLSYDQELLEGFLTGLGIDLM